MLLLAGHLFPVPGIDLGIVGVNLFFVLSGLLMAELLFVKQTPISNFYKRRSSRIFPTHYLYLCVIVAWFYLSGRPIEWSETTAAALLVKNYFPGDFGHTLMPFGHIWSLCVEEQSYILLSFIAMATRRGHSTPAALVICCAVAAAGSGLWYAVHFPSRQLEFWYHMEVSGYGILISAFFLLQFRRTGIPKLPYWIYPLLLMMGVMLHWWSVPAPIKTTVGMAVLAFTVNLLPGAPPSIKRMLSLRPLRVMGIWSFSIYLWQQPFYIAAQLHRISGIVALACAMLTGICSFYFFEQPIRRYLNRAWATKAEELAL